MRGWRTYAFKIGLKRRKNLFNCTFDEHTSDETEAFAVRIGFGCFVQRVDYKSMRVQNGRRK